MVNKKDVMILLEMKSDKKRRELWNKKNPYTDKVNKIKDKIRVKTPLRININGLNCTIKRGNYEWEVKIVDKGSLTLEKKEADFYKAISEEKEKIISKTNEIKEKILLYGLDAEIIKYIEELK